MKNNTDSDIPPLLHENNQYSTPMEKATLLNSYFSEQSNIDDSHASLPAFDPPLITLNNIVITETGVEDVLKLLNTIQAKQVALT